MSRLLRPLGLGLLPSMRSSVRSHATPLVLASTSAPVPALGSRKSGSCSFSRRAPTPRYVRYLSRPPIGPTGRGANALLLNRLYSSAHSVSPLGEPQGAPLEQPEPRCSHDAEKISIEWGAGRSSNFHHIWLRDHCRCAECFHPITKQRLLNTFEISLSLQPAKVESGMAGLQVTWQSFPPHTSTYPWDWLRRHSYDPVLSSQETSASGSRASESTLWSSRIKDSPPTVSYEHVMGDQKGLLEWLRNIETFGFSFVEGVPPTPEATEELTRRIAPIRETHYGGFWEFTSDLAHGDTAYTTLALGAHTDTTYYTDPCGLQLFHLLSHEGTGGSTLLVDGFYAASVLQERHPEHFATLSGTKIITHAAGSEGVLYTSQEGYPILEVDEKGEVRGVRYNNDDRSVLKVEGARVQAWYDALRAWNECLTSPDAEYWVQLTPGTVVVMDNHRVLHGRSAFTGKRRMCGAYVGKDDWKSKLRVLEEAASAGWPGEGKVQRSNWGPYF